MIFLFSLTLLLFLSFQAAQQPPKYAQLQNFYQTHQAELEKIYQGEDTLQKVLNMMQQAKRKLDAQGVAMPMAAMAEEDIPISDIYQIVDKWLEDHKGLVKEVDFKNKVFMGQSLIANLNGVKARKEYQNILAAALVENLSVLISDEPQVVNSTLIQSIDDALESSKTTFSNNYKKKAYRADEGKELDGEDIKITAIPLTTWLLSCFSESYTDDLGNTIILTGADEANAAQRLKEFNKRVDKWQALECTDLRVEDNDTLAVVLEHEKLNITSKIVTVNLGNDTLADLVRSEILTEIKTTLANVAQKELLTYKRAMQETVQIVDKYANSYNKEAFFFKNDLHNLSEEDFASIELPKNIYEWLIEFKGDAKTKASEVNIKIKAILEAIIEVINKISIKLGDNNFKWGGPEIDFLIKNIKNIIKLPGFNNENNLEINFDIESLIKNLRIKNDFSTTEVKTIIENHFKPIINNSTNVTNNITNNFNTSFEYYKFSFELLRIQNEINTKIYALLLAQINTKLSQENKIEYVVNHKSFNSISFNSFSINNELYQNLNIEINFSHVEEKKKNWYFLSLGDIYIMPGNTRGFELVGGKVKARKLDKKGDIQYYGATITNKSTYEYSFFRASHTNQTYKIQKDVLAAQLKRGTGIGTNSGWFASQVNLDLNIFGVLGWEQQSAGYTFGSEQGEMVTYSGGQSSYQVEFGIKQTIDQKEIILEVVDLKMTHTDSKQVVPIKAPTQKIREKKLK